MDDRYVDFDDVLPHVGEFGKYQWGLFAALAPFCANMAFVYITQIFLTLTPDHWCRVPELEGVNLTQEEKISLSIPVTVDAVGTVLRDSCRSYDVDYAQLLQDGVSSGNASWPLRTCREFEYNLTSTGDYHTIVSEYDWVCGRGWYATFAQVMFFVGSIVGGLLAGYAADRYGRVPVLCGANLVAAVASLLTVYSQSIVDFTFYRFLMGMAFDNCFVMMYVLVLEYIGPKHRTLVANLSIAIFFTLGDIAVPWMALALKNWRFLSALTGLPMALSLFGYICIPESARWLLSQGRVHETITILKRIASVNGRTIPPQVLKDFETSTLKDLQIETSSVTAPTVLDLFRTPRMRKITIFLIILWMMITIAYDGHTRNVVNLPVDLYLTFTLAAATELPADVFLVLTMDRLGRRWLGFLCMVMCGIFSFVIIAVPAGNAGGVASTIIIARFFVNVGMNVGMQYAAELLPTQVRAQGVAFIHIIGYVANMISPLIVFLRTVAWFLPSLVLGAAAVVGGVSTLFLPETLHRDLPQTMEDGENFGSDQRFFYFPWINGSSERTRLGMVPLDPLDQQPSFVRRRQGRASIRGEIYRSSLLTRHRKEVLYIPSAD
ncbi:solute carrier family 22 member 1-like [Oratosquilla oratoria]|uniref:solute carrier family 22 member 1-like n=1 Tax=Oratosquilla oratoria TaxID=337810 RepID=UPI003F771D9F